MRITAHTQHPRWSPCRPKPFNKPEPGLTAPDRLIRCMQLGPIHANRVAAGHVGQLRKLAATVRTLPAARLVHFARTPERWQNLTLNAPEKAHASTQAPPPAHTHLLYPTPHRNGLASFPPRALRPLVCGTGFSFVRRFVGYTNISSLPGTIGNLESLQELCAPLTTPTWHFQELSSGTAGKWPAHESSHCRRPSGTASNCAYCACTPRPQPIRASKIIS